MQTGRADKRAARAAAAEARLAENAALRVGKQALFAEMEALRFQASALAARTAAQGDEISSLRALAAAQAAEIAARISEAAEHAIATTAQAAELAALADVQAAEIGAQAAEIVAQNLVISRVYCDRNIAVLLAAAIAHRGGAGGVVVHADLPGDVHGDWLIVVLRLEGGDVSWRVPRAGVPYWNQMRLASAADGPPAEGDVVAERAADYARRAFE